MSQEADIGVLVDGFIGREWLRTRLEQWRQHERDSRLFWVSGSAGMGKSAFAAWLAHHGKVNVIALNLCRYNVDERRDPARVLRTLAFQVATRLPDYRRLLLDRLVKQDRDGTEILRKSPAALFDWLVAEPMHLSIDGGRRAHRFLVVIDALDETIRDRRSELAEVLADSAPKLPPWIAIVVTSRPEPAILRQFAALKPQTIDAEADENLNDLRTYAHGWLAAQQRPPGEIGALVERIVAASGGNFLYLRKLREAADAGLLDLAVPENLPQGLVGLYDRWFRRQFATAADYEVHVPLLEVLVAAEHPVPEPWLARVFGWSPREQARMLEGLGSLFERRTAGVAPFHKSLRDWLTDARAAGADFVVDANAGTRRLAEALWAALVLGLRAKAPLDAFAVAEMPLQIMRAPAATVRAGLVAAGPWSELWTGLADQAAALAARFAWDAVLAWWRMAAFLAETSGEVARSNQSFALRSAGDIMRTLGRSQDALDLYQASLAMSRTLSKQHPDDAEWRRNIYVSLIRIGNVLQAGGDHAGALATHREGLDIIRVLSAGDAGNAQRRREVSVSLERVGDVLKDKGDLAGALASYREGLEIVRALARDGPADAEHRRDVSVRLAKIGDVLMDQGDVGGARAAYRESLDVMRALADESPNDVRRQRDVYASLIRVGDELEVRGDPAGALASFREGLDIVRPLIVSDPDNTEWRRDVWVSLLKVADVLKANGDIADALVSYREALEIVRVLAAKDVHNTQWQLDIVASLWRLALVDDDASVRWREALAILQGLRALERLAPAQLGWIDTIETELADTDGKAP